jgi:hypothetical protein
MELRGVAVPGEYYCRYNGSEARVTIEPIVKPTGKKFEETYTKLCHDRKLENQPTVFLLSEIPHLIRDGVEVTDVEEMGFEVTYATRQDGAWKSDPPIILYGTLPDPVQYTLWLPLPDAAQYSAHARAKEILNVRFLGPLKLSEELKKDITICFEKKPVVIRKAEAQELFATVASRGGR